MAPFQVAIVGGGLCGALLANGLINNGVEVTVYERDSVNSNREGYQIRVGEAAKTGFDACLSEERKATIKSKLGKSSSATATAPIICSSQFKTILDLTKASGYSKSSAINRVVLRNILIDPVADAGRVKYSKNMVRYEIARDEHNNEKVVIHFTDRSTVTCDLLIGADGSSSKVNSQVGARNLVEIKSHMMLLNKGSLPIKRIKELPEILRKGPLLTFAGDKLLYFALYLPARRQLNTGSEDVEVEYDVDEASFYWGLTVPRSEYPHEDLRGLKDRLQFCLDQTKTWALEYRSMISCGAEDGQTENIIVAPLRASKVLPKRWREALRHRAGNDPLEGHPRVWLMGDAIHAMQPNRGMGGNQALQDCADALPEILKLNEISKAGNLPSAEQVRQGLEIYEGKMMERAFKWVKKSGGTSVTVGDLP